MATFFETYSEDVGIYYSAVLYTAGGKRTYCHWMVPGTTDAAF